VVEAGRAATRKEAVMSRLKKRAGWFAHHVFSALLMAGTGCAWMGQSDDATAPAPIPGPTPAQAADPTWLPSAEPAAPNPPEQLGPPKPFDPAAPPKPANPPAAQAEAKADPWQVWRTVTPAAFVEPPTGNAYGVAQGSAPAGAAPVAPAAPPPLSAPDVPIAKAPANRREFRKLAIDLPYALRLANASNPTIATALERINQARAQLLAARVSFLPDIWVGGNPDNYGFLPTFYHHGGEIQNAAGNVFPVTKNFVDLPAGASINYKLADVIFAPYIARDSAAAIAARARVVRTNIQLEVALTYLDLVRAYGALAINAESLARAKQMYAFANQAIQNGLGKTTADANRASTEVEIRTQQQFEFEGQAAVVSAKLAQLLLLEPTVDLVPGDPKVVPIALVSNEPEIEDLIAIGLMNRPEMAESRALVGAAYKRWQQDRSRPFLPTLSVVFYGSQFGGGSNLFGTPEIHTYGGRDDFMAQAAWELKNLGFGDLARARESRSQYNQANLHVAEVTAEVAADVTAAAKLVGLRQRSLQNGQEAVRQAEEMWTRLAKAAFGMVGGARRYDPLEPLIAEQQLNQARMMYLDEVIAFNRYQLRLYWAMGQPPLSAMPEATSLPVQVPVLPSKAQQEGTDREKQK
jgi:outer membrane protein TolC